MYDFEGYQKWYDKLYTKGRKESNEDAKLEKEKKPIPKKQKAKGLSEQMWNPSGDMTWSFVDCEITNAYDSNGNENMKEFGDKYQANPSICD